MSITLLGRKIYNDTTSKAEMFYGNGGNMLYSYAYHLLTLVIISIGWLIFRETNFSELLTSFKALIGLYGLGSVTALYYLGIFSFRYILALILGIILTKDIISKDFKESKLFDVILLILLILCIIYVVVGSYNPFIYFRF